MTHYSISNRVSGEQLGIYQGDTHTITIPPPERYDTLEELRDAMVDHDLRVTDALGEWSTDGHGPEIGPRPRPDGGAWAWTETHVLVGSCADDLSVWSREDWEDEV